MRGASICDMRLYVRCHLVDEMRECYVDLLLNDGIGPTHQSYSGRSDTTSTNKFASVAFKRINLYVHVCSAGV